MFGLVLYLEYRERFLAEMDTNWKLLLIDLVEVDGMGWI